MCLALYKVLGITVMNKRHVRFALEGLWSTIGRDGET